MSLPVVLWTLCLLPFLIWVGLLLMQSVCAVFSPAALLLSASRPRLAILIPAHNEASGILSTLRSLQTQLLEGDRLLVIADNCDDDTAQIATAAGAEVVERRNASLRGKGYALDCGVRHLGLGPEGLIPEVVIVVDADCSVEDGSIDLLARACKATRRPIQALYLMQSPTATKGLRQLREFAWLVRNLVRPLGYLRLGQPCQLMGTGMAFPWPLIVVANLANAHLVEDMQLGLDLARAGAAPLFCPLAVVTSEFPTHSSGEQQQRRRWEHGHLGMIAAVPAMLLEAIGKRNGNLFALAIDMSVPPLALLVSLLLSLMVLATVLASGFLLAATLGLLLLLAVAILLAWWCFGRKVLQLHTLLLAPVYALAKLPLYIGFLRRRQVEWVRSSRD
jgi:cellulose synthase/poly-beta-1,6-N-acetylglucosamine synthase-like glycosyltransferase